MTPPGLDAHQPSTGNKTVPRPQTAQPGSVDDTMPVKRTRRDAASRSADVLAYVEILNALSELDPVGRIALRLIYWHDRTQAQVAADLHLPPSAVRAAVGRGMRHLADHLTNPAAPRRSVASSDAATSGQAHGSPRAGS